MQLKFTTILQYEQLPEISTHIILFIKNLNELLSTGSVQGNTHTGGGEENQQPKSQNKIYFRTDLKE